MTCLPRSIHMILRKKMTENVSRSLMTISSVRTLEGAKTWAFFEKGRHRAVCLRLNQAVQKPINQQTPGALPENQPLNQPTRTTHDRQNEYCDGDFRHFLSRGGPEVLTAKHPNHLQQVFFSQSVYHQVGANCEAGKSQPLSTHLHGLNGRSEFHNSIQPRFSHPATQKPGLYCCSFFENDVRLLPFIFPEMRSSCSIYLSSLLTLRSNRRLSGLNRIATNSALTA